MGREKTYNTLVCWVESEITQVDCCEVVNPGPHHSRGAAYPIKESSGHPALRATQDSDQGREEALAQTEIFQDSGKGDRDGKNVGLSGPEFATNSPRKH